MYLPQYHAIYENDKFWGKGFTDWVSVKNAKSLYKGHYEPRIPMDSNYYDLSIKDNVKWQANLAKEYGIDGLGIYHYWFNNEKNLLTKPAEIILENNDIETEFFFAWDNANWKRSWSSVEGNDWAPAMDKNIQKKGEPLILIPYLIGEEADWTNHYNWLRPYFLDKRYIKKENKPLFVIFNYDEKIAQMCKCWEELARQDGLDGVFFIFRYGENYHIPEKEYVFTYEPLFSGWNTPPTLLERIVGKIGRTIGVECGPKKYSYDKVWQALLENARNMNRKEMFHGAFVMYDDTPRRGKRGKLTVGETAEKFEIYLSELLKISSSQGKDFVFLTAWNEWGEGAYLEPDDRWGYSYLEAIKRTKANL